MGAEGRCFLSSSNVSQHLRDHCSVMIGFDLYAFPSVFLYSFNGRAKFAQF